MKTIPPRYRFPAPSSNRLRGPILALCLVSFVTANELPPAAPKTHTLYMGADISVEYDKQLYQVQSVIAGAFVINVKGKEEKIAVDWSRVNLKVDRSLKLTGSSAVVKNFKSDRAFTLGNDPVVKFQRNLATAEIEHADSQAAQNQSEAKFRLGDTALAIANKVSRDPMAPLEAGTQALERKVAQQKYQQKQFQVAHAVGAELYNSSSALADTGSFDAMEVTFEIAADQRLSDPYVVFLGQFHAHDAPAGKVSNWVYAQPLDPISSESHRVHILRGGFPLAFVMDELQVHFYNRGKEIATDVAPKRVPLTREEAFTYALIEYQGTHKEATLPATPLMGRLSPDAKAQLSPGQLTQAYFVKVSKDGRPITAFQDAACTRAVDESDGRVDRQHPVLSGAAKGQSHRRRGRTAIQPARPVGGRSGVLQFPATTNRQT